MFLLILFLYLTPGNAALQPQLTGGATEITSSDSSLFPAMKSFLEDYYPADEFQFSILPKRIPDYLSENEFQVETIQYNGRGLPKSYTVLTVTGKNKGKTVQESIQVEIVVSQKLPVAKERIPKGTPVKESDFVYSWIDVTRYKGTFVTKVNDIAGLVSQSFLVPGRPLRPTDFTSPPVILAGHTATMIYKQNGFSLTLQVTARSDAALGEECTVYCEDTRRTYRVKPINDSTVEWIQTL